MYSYYYDSSSSSLLTSGSVGEGPAIVVGREKGKWGGGRPIGGGGGPISGAINIKHMPFKKPMSLLSLASSLFACSSSHFILLSSNSIISFLDFSWASMNICNICLLDFSTFSNFVVFLFLTRDGPGCWLSWSLEVTFEGGGGCWSPVAVVFDGSGSRNIWLWRWLLVISNSWVRAHNQGGGIWWSHYWGFTANFITFICCLVFLIPGNLSRAGHTRSVGGLTTVLLLITLCMLVNHLKCTKISWSSKSSSDSIPTPLCLSLLTVSLYFFLSCLIFLRHCLKLRTNPCVCSSSEIAW